MDEKNENWFEDLFIEEAKMALKRHSGGGSGSLPLQYKTATKNGEVVPDEGYGGLSKVSINIPTAEGVAF